MIINNVGYNHCHDADFFINRPEGSGDYLLLLLKTDAVFILDNAETIIPKNSVFIYPKGMPQYYKCLPQQTFENNWIHFLFEPGEEQEFLKLNIPYSTPIKIDSIYFLDFCFKSIAYGFGSCNLYKDNSISNFISLIFNKISERLNQESMAILSSKQEMLVTIRNKIYSKPFESRTVESAAHEVRMCKSAFQRSYKETFGVTFIEDLTESRIAYAKMLLATTNLSVTEIAFQSGYKTYAHFTRQFRKKCNLTPTEFRSLLQSNR